MPYEINGIELIETTVSNGFVIFMDIFASVMIAIATICLIAILTGGVYNDRCSNILATVALIAAIILFVYLIVFASQHGTITHYKVTFSDTMTMQDFLEFESHYDIVEKENEYFIITER